MKGYHAVCVSRGAGRKPAIFALLHLRMFSRNHSKMKVRLQISICQHTLSTFHTQGHFFGGNSYVRLRPCERKSDTISKHKRQDHNTLAEKKMTPDIDFEST